MTSPIRVTAVVFDYGGVLTSPLFAGLERYAAELGLPPATFNRFLRGDPMVHQVELGRVAARELFKYMCVEVQAVHDVRIDIRRLAEAAGEVLNPAAVDPAMVELVAELHLRYGTALLTNNVKGGGWRERFPFHLFDHVLDSSELGMRKPDSRIYAELVARLGCPPNEMVFVDDFEENLEPAAALGIHPILFTGVEETRAALGRLGVGAMA